MSAIERRAPGDAGSTSDFAQTIEGSSPNIAASIWEYRLLSS